MVTKELLKQLFVTFQDSLPQSVKSRTTLVPVDTEKIKPPLSSFASTDNSGTKSPFFGKN